MAPDAISKGTVRRLDPLNPLTIQLHLLSDQKVPGQLCRDGRVLMSGPGVYYVNNNAQENGDHEVHNGSRPCEWFHKIKSKERLGHFNNCHEAVAAAKKIYWKSNGCAFCARDCHTA